MWLSRSTYTCWRLVDVASGKNKGGCRIEIGKCTRWIAQIARSCSRIQVFTFSDLLCNLRWHGAVRRSRVMWQGLRVKSTNLKVLFWRSSTIASSWWYQLSMSVVNVHSNCWSNKLHELQCSWTNHLMISPWTLIFYEMSGALYCFATSCDEINQLAQFSPAVQQQHSMVIESVCIVGDWNPSCKHWGHSSCEWRMRRKKQ